MRNDNNYSKGHEPKLYEALSVIVGLFLTFTIVEMKEPNKQLNRNIIKRPYITGIFFILAWNVTWRLWSNGLPSFTSWSQHTHHAKPTR